ncbi:MAG: metal-dependent transcriptional regulator, partial [Bacteroidetes bacterium]|nr:metal-dependent transcriptional regulator [Bacteroidota bacterium]
MMNLSETEENYLKAVFHICQTEAKTASTNAISARLQTTAASVSDMIKKLSDKDLIAYEKYKGVSLTKEGKQIAIRLIRKHRLWEVFLVEKLGFKWDEVHDVAEQLEHIKSPELIKKLDLFLDFPKFDPHGDPIPDEEGKMHNLALQKLSLCLEGNVVVLMGVADSSVDFLQYLNQLGLHLGLEIRIGKKFPFDQSQEL